MPDELSYQRLIITVVKDHGGFAFKSSNRFLVGVADLWVGLPPYRLAFLECKLNPIPKRKHSVALGTTVQQERFLTNVRKGGALAGVVSFIRDDKQLGMVIVPETVKEVPLTSYRFMTHVFRQVLVETVLERWFNGTR